MNDRQLPRLPGRAGTLRAACEDVFGLANSDAARVLPHRRRRRRRRPVARRDQHCRARSADGGGSGRGGSQPQEIGAWLHIGEDGAVTVYTGKVEVGQNIRTSLTQVVAEELRAPVDAIRMVMADTAAGAVRRRHVRQPDDAGDGAAAAPRRRRGARGAARPGRRAGQGRSQHAAPSTDGKVVGAERNAVVRLRRADQGQEADRRSSATSATQTPRRQVDGRRHVGAEGRRPGVRHRRAPVCLGRAAGPGMLFGKVLRPPAFKAKLASVRHEGRRGDARRHRGARRRLRRRRRADRMRPRQGASPRSRPSGRPAPQPSERGTVRVPEGTSGARRRRRLRRRRPGDSQGSIDDGLQGGRQDGRRRPTPSPTSPTCRWSRAPPSPSGTDGKLTVWTGTQRPFGVRGELASAFGCPCRDRCASSCPTWAPATAASTRGEAAVEAARLAKAAGKPVKLVWTREEEFTWAYFRPAGVIDVTRRRASKDGTLTAWEFHNYNSGGSAIATPYDVPNRQTEFHGADSPLRQGSYRGLGGDGQHFARESHMDELAHAVGMDPLEFRLKNLKDDAAAGGARSGRQAVRLGRSQAGGRPRLRHRGRHGEGQLRRHLCRGRGRPQDAASCKSCAS